MATKKVTKVEPVEKTVEQPAVEPAPECCSIDTMKLKREHEALKVQHAELLLTFGQQQARIGLLEASLRNLVAGHDGSIPMSPEILTVARKILG